MPLLLHNRIDISFCTLCTYGNHVINNNRNIWTSVCGLQIYIL